MTDESRGRGKTIALIVGFVGCSLVILACFGCIAFGAVGAYLREAEGDHGAFDTTPPAPEAAPWDPGEVDASARTPGEPEWARAFPIGGQPMPRVGPPQVRDAHPIFVDAEPRRVDPNAEFLMLCELRFGEREWDPGGVFGRGTRPDPIATVTIDGGASVRVVGGNNRLSMFVSVARARLRPGSEIVVTAYDADIGRDDPMGRVRITVGDELPVQGEADATMVECRAVADEVVQSRVTREVEAARVLLRRGAGRMLADDATVPAMRSAFRPIVRAISEAAAWRGWEDPAVNALAAEVDVLVAQMVSAWRTRRAAHFAAAHPPGVAATFGDHTVTLERADCDAEPDGERHCSMHVSATPEFPGGAPAASLETPTGRALPMRHLRSEAGYTYRTPGTLDDDERPSEVLFELEWRGERIYFRVAPEAATDTPE